MWSIQNRAIRQKAWIIAACKRVSRKASQVALAYPRQNDNMSAKIPTSWKEGSMEFNPLTYPLTFAAPTFFSDASTWLQHIPFAYTLTSILRPSRFVELGVQKGDSYMAFCQAIKALGIPAQCTAIDTWKGDIHVGFYSDPLPQLRSAHDPAYGAFSNLLQSTFDDAVGNFADGSIDLLHIDGLHTYEAVRHDYETWLPKLSPRGVVLFHDTAVLDRGFGVHKFFPEVAERHPHFSFHHGYGLGIVAPNAETPAAMLAFLADANANAEAVRACYATLGHRIETMCGLYLMMHRFVRMQRAINNGLRRQNVQVDPQSERLEAAMSNPIGYLDTQAKSLEGLLASISMLAK
jgi:hypothetical protein